MAITSRPRGVARLGVVALALAIQMVNPLVPNLAHAAGSPPIPTPTPAASPTPPAVATPAPAATPVASPTAPTIQSAASTGARCTDPGPKDYPVAGGWFYTEEAQGLCIIGAGPDRNRGYLVVDDDKGAFWTEFRRFGGVDVLGYPVSQPYHYPVNSTDGLWYQAFERGVLQWRPDLGRAEMANVFDQFTEQGLDDDLAVLGIPGPQAPDDKSSLGAEINARMSWLTEPRFLARYFFDPVGAHSSDPLRDGQSAFSTQEQAWSFFGLPQSQPERMSLLGPGRQPLYPLVHSFMAQRFQKAGMQLFFEDAPKESFATPTWSDSIPVQFDPTVVPGDGQKGCVSLTAVGMLARSIGADKLIPSQALEPQPLDPAPRPSVLWFVPPVSQGQLTTSFQLMGASFGSAEQVTISLTDARLNPNGTLLSPISARATTTRDGSFNTVIPAAAVGTYRITATGLTSGKMFIDTIDLTIPSGIYVSGGGATGTATCKPVGVPVGS
jgi:hypothetical protein